MAGQLPICPGCGVAITWSAPSLGKLRLKCACHSMVFDVASTSKADVAALKKVVERELCEAYTETMAMAAVISPEAGVRQ